MAEDYSNQGSPQINPTAPRPMVKMEDGSMQPMPDHLMGQVSQSLPPAPHTNGNVTNIADKRREKLDRSELMALLPPKRAELYVEQWDKFVMVQGMTAAQSDQQQALQNTTIRLKRDGTAEYDARLNQLRAQIVCDHTFWLDGTKVFDQVTDALLLQESDNALVSLFFGAIDDMSSTTREQLDAAKKGLKMTPPMN